MFVNVTSFKICSKYFLFLSLYIGCKEEKAALMPMLLAFGLVVDSKRYGAFCDFVELNHLQCLTVLLRLPSGTYKNLA